MPKAIPGWLSALMALVDQWIQAILAAEQQEPKNAEKRGCDPTTDPACLTLHALRHQACAFQATLKAHASLCCGPDEQPASSTGGAEGSGQDKAGQGSPEAAEDGGGKGQAKDDHKGGHKKH